MVLADQATSALGEYGAVANLTVLAAGILIVFIEVVLLRPKRDATQQAAYERMQQLFLEECQRNRDAHRESITELRTEWNLQRTEQLRMHERNCDVTANLATAVQHLSDQFASPLNSFPRTDNAPREQIPRAAAAGDRQAQAGDRPAVPGDR